MKNKQIVNINNRATIHRPLSNNLKARYGNKCI